MRIGEVLKKYRLVSEISQKQLSMEIGIHQTTWNRIEHGGTGIDGETLVKIIIWLFNEKKEDPDGKRQRSAGDDPGETTQAD